jgi:hypothetical protein
MQTLLPMIWSLLAHEQNKTIIHGIASVYTAELAQSVERTTLNRVVKGSIPLFGAFFLQCRVDKTAKDEK